jgi:hypothetical protein
MTGPAAFSEIPFEGQRTTPDTRMCGAAALCMVYRSFGLACEQAEVWEAVARGPRGRRLARTHLLCKDAVRRGLFGLIVQAAEPWTALRYCSASGLRVILNHRLSPAKLEGHYTVLVRTKDDAVVLHDPAAGPERWIARDEFLRLWKPPRSRSEITGDVYIALTDQPPAAAACTACGAVVPGSHRCDGCRQPFPVHPAAALGCTEPNCPQRVWQRIFCPECDTAVDRFSE